MPKEDCLSGIDAGTEASNGGNSSAATEDACSSTDTGMLPEEDPSLQLERLQNELEILRMRITKQNKGAEIKAHPDPPIQQATPLLLRVSSRWRALLFLGALFPTLVSLASLFASDSKLAISGMLLYVFR